MRRLLRWSSILFLLTVALFGAMVSMPDMQAEPACYTFAAVNKEGETRNYVGSLDGQSLQNIGASLDIGFVSDWNRTDGIPEKVVYQRGYGPAVTYSYNNTTRKRYRLHGEDSRFEISNVAWSPDGHWIAYRAFLDEGVMTGIVDEEGKNRQEFWLSETTKGFGLSIWSADSAFVAMESANGYQIVSPTKGVSEEIPFPESAQSFDFRWDTIGHHYIAVAITSRNEIVVMQGEIGKPESRRERRWSGVLYPSLGFHEIISDGDLVVLNAFHDTGLQVYALIIGQEKPFLLENLEQGQTIVRWMVSSDQRKVLYVVRVEVGNGGRVVEFDTITHTRRVLLENVSQVLYEHDIFAAIGRVETDGQKLGRNVLLLGESPDNLRSYFLPEFESHSSAVGIPLMTMESMLGYLQDRLANIHDFPVLQNIGDHRFLLAGDNGRETIVNIYQTEKQTVRTWRKLGTVIRLAFLGDWIGFTIFDGVSNSSVWLLNMVTGQEISFGAGHLVRDAGNLVFLQADSNSAIFKIIDRTGNAIATYQAPASHDILTPLRSPDNKHALIPTTRLTPGQYPARIYLYNGDTGQTTTLRDTNSVGMFYFAQWLPDSKEFLGFFPARDGLDVFLMNVRSETLWTRFLPEIQSVERVEIIECSMIEQLDMLRITRRNPPG